MVETSHSETDAQAVTPDSSESAHPDRPGLRRIRPAALLEAAAHPFLVAVLAAFLSSWLLARFTIDYEAHRTDADHKTQMVSAITRSSDHAMDAVLLAQVKTRTNLLGAANEWRTDSEVIGVQLQVFYPSNPIPEKWQAYSGQISALMLWVLGGEDWNQLANLRRAVPLVPAGVWTSLKGQCRSHPSPTPAACTAVWFTIDRHLAQGRQALLQDVVKTETSS